MVGLIIAYSVVAVFNGLFAAYAIYSSKHPPLQETKANQDHHIKVMKELGTAFGIISAGGILAISTLVMVPDIGRVMSLGVLIVFILSGGIKLTTSMKKLIR
ncbi:MAG TPA: hypothetical protein PLR26_01110 [Bacilli bacterium]|nr:hypothetical protein [Bacilli bacterium]